MIFKGFKDLKRSIKGERCGGLSLNPEDQMERHMGTQEAGRPGGLEAGSGVQPDSSAPAQRGLIRLSVFSS